MTPSFMSVPESLPTPTKMITWHNFIYGISARQMLQIHWDGLWYHTMFSLKNRFSLDVSHRAYHTRLLHVETLPTRYLFMVLYHKNEEIFHFTWKIEGDDCVRN